MGKLKKAVKKIAKKATGLVQNVVSSPVKAVSSIAKGDVLGAATNIANVATMGAVDATGGKVGIININTKKYAAKMMGAKPLAGATMFSSGTGLVTKGLLTQLRKGKGSLGGGSYTETVKNPLGGTSGKTGK